MTDPSPIPEDARQVLRMLEPIGEVICFQSVDGLILQVNAAVEVLTGYAVSDFNTNPGLWLDLVDKTESPEEVATDTGNWIVKTSRIHRRDGECRWIRTRMLRMDDDSGRLAGYLCLHTDISDLKAAEARISNERDRAQEFLDIAGVIFVVLDADEKVTLINKKGCQIIGGHESDMIGRNWFDTFIPTADRERTREGFRSLMAGDMMIAEHFENTILTLDGEERHILWHNAVLRDPRGQIIGTLSSGQDVTEQRRAERELEKQEEQLRVLFEGTHSCISMIEDRIIKFVNQATANAFGYTVEELIGQETSFIHTSQESFEAAGKLAYPDLEQNGVWEGELPYRRKDGSIVWMANYVSTLSSGGNVVVMHDVTEQLQIRADLEDREARLSSIFRAAPIGIGLVVNRVLQEVNEQICNMLGYNREQLIGQSSRMIYASDEDFEYAGRAKTDVILKGGTRSIETHWRRKDGETIHVLLNSTPLDPGNLEKGVTFTALNVTDLKRTQAELQHGQDLLRRAEQIAHVGSFDWNLKTDESVASDEAFRILGLEPNSIDPGFQTFRNYVHPEDMGEVDRRLQQAFTGGGFEFSHRIIRADGATRVIHHRGQVFYDAEGNPERMIGTYHDVTDVKEAEDALVEKNIALREVLKQISQETDAIKQQVGTNIEEAIVPTLLRLKEMATPSQAGLLESLHRELDTISSPFLTSLRRRHVQLTPRETEVCRLIKNGLTSKEIADSLGLSVATIHKHRETIRRKLGLANQNINLASYLQSL